MTMTYTYIIVVVFLKQYFFIFGRHEWYVNAKSSNKSNKRISFIRHQKSTILFNNKKTQSYTRAKKKIFFLFNSNNTNCYILLWSDKSKTIENNNAALHIHILLFIYMPSPYICCIFGRIYTIFVKQYNTECKF